MWSEVSPLPGWHTETLEQATDQVIAQLRQPGSVVDMYPSVRMGFDMLKWQLDGGTTKSLADIQLRALWHGNREDLETWTIWAVRQDYKGIKIKVGRLPIEKELDVIRTVRNIVGPGFEITLDANQKFTLDQAIEFARACSKYDIMYIEDPVEHIDDVARFYVATGMTVALDNLTPNPSPDRRGVRGEVWVIKPSCVGGLARLKSLCEQAKQSGIKIVFSSAFESKIGISLWMQLAAEFGTPGVAHGLDTLTWFSEDLNGDNCKEIGMYGIENHE
jgi:O-succinylbenzoate synthase